MALIIRDKYIRGTRPPCGKDCKDRKVGCHSKCQKYNDWKKANRDRKAAIKKFNRDIAAVEDYEIIQKQKNMKKR